METQIELLKKIWKFGLVSLITLIVSLTGFFLSFRGTGATVLASCSSDHSSEWDGDEDCDEESPSPLPSPTPSTCETCGGSTNTNTITNTNENNQEQKQENNQTVNVTVSQPEVEGVETVAVPVKQPETGVSVLGLASMFGAGPAGLLLARHGRGRLERSKEEENLAKIGRNLVFRRGRKAVV